MSRLSVEQKALVIILCVAVVVLLYAGVFKKATRRTNESPRSALSDFIPPKGQEVIHKTDSYTMSRKIINMKKDGVPLQISLIMVQPDKKHLVIRPPTVLLLHGHADDSNVWRELGTLQLIGEMGHEAYAIDLPGAGDTKIRGKLAHAEFMYAFAEYMELDRPLLVAASDGGAFAFDYIFDVPETLREKISGFVALSPIQSLAHGPKVFHYLNTVYTVLVHGDVENDLPGEESIIRFKKVEPVDIQHINGGSHVHYKERPDLFHNILVKALKNLED